MIVIPSNEEKAVILMDERQSNWTDKKININVNFMATSELSMNTNLAKLLKAAECGLIQSGTRLESEDSEHFSRINLWSRSANGNTKRVINSVTNGFVGEVNTPLTVWTEDKSFSKL